MLRHQPTNRGSPNWPGTSTLPAIRADLLHRLGRHAEAEAAYREALALTRNEAERALLRERLDGVR